MKKANRVVVNRDNREMFTPYEDAVSQIMNECNCTRKNASIRLCYYANKFKAARGTKSEIETVPFEKRYTRINNYGKKEQQPFDLQCGQSLIKPNSNFSIDRHLLNDLNDISKLFVQALAEKGNTTVYKVMAEMVNKHCDKRLKELL